MSSTARLRQQRQRWRPKGLSGALDHRMALQRAHSIRGAEHEPLDARQKRGGGSQLTSSQQQRRATQGDSSAQRGGGRWQPGGGGRKLDGGVAIRVRVLRAWAALRAEQTRLSVQEQMHKPVSTLSGVGGE